MTRSIDELLVYHQVNPCIFADAPENLPVVIFLGGERLPEVVFCPGTQHNGPAIILHVEPSVVNISVINAKPQLLPVNFKEYILQEIAFAPELLTCDSKLSILSNKEIVS